MKLNSFCVIVSRDGALLHLESPQPLEQTLESYKLLRKKWYENEDIIVSWDNDFAEKSIRPLCGDWMQNKIKQWKGMMNFLTPMFTTICIGEQNANGVKIELLHESRV